jgi:ADP-heptose:LPS heptosyltransferase
VSAPTGIIQRAAAPFAGAVNRARLGLPRHFFESTGLLGDDLMCSAVFRELKKRGGRKIAFATQHDALFKNNPDVDRLIGHSSAGLAQWGQLGLPVKPLTYTRYDAMRDYDTPPDEHALIKMFRAAGVGGPVELRPYLFLTAQEFAAGKLGDHQVVIQSSNASSTQAMRNKEWYPARFQEVCSELRLDLTVIQLGSVDDPKLEGAKDLRGKTSLREAAAILANSLVFVGLVSFLMHLARAVDCRSVIIYGGREKPAQTGYVANKNLYSQVRCAPCWLRNPCDFDRKCMDMITPQHVIAAAAEQIARYGTLLDVQTAQL